MTSRSSAAPGSAEFGARLLERLRADENVGGAPAIESVATSSRNTVIYRVRSGETALVCKAERGTRRSWIEAEYRKLVELQRRLAGTGVRSLVPISVYADLGVIVTREEPGETVRRYIDRGLLAPRGSEARRIAEGLMEPCAEVLFRFHGIFGRSYTDFDPKNLLVTPADGGIAIVMMDPPPRELERTPHWDISLFCFGIARAGFAPHALIRLSQNWLDELKAQFVAAYFRRLGRPITRADLEAIKASERARGRRAIRRYAQFHRFPNWPLELARMAYFSPIIAAYVAFHLPKSYRQLETAGS